MKPSFREDKVTQVAAYFLKLRGNNKMSHLKLMKLLYIAEREALNRLGRPICFDVYVSMNQGPVLSTTLNLMHGESEKSEYWDEFITSPANHELTLKGDPGIGKLSSAEVQILTDVFKEYGCKSRWELAKFTHKFNEWKNPEGSSIKIDYEDILRALNKKDDEIKAIIDDLNSTASLD